MRGFFCLEGHRRQGRKGGQVFGHDIAHLILYLNFRPVFAFFKNLYHCARHKLTQGIIARLILPAHTYFVRSVIRLIGPGDLTKTLALHIGSKFKVSGKQITNLAGNKNLGKALALFKDDSNGAVVMLGQGLGLGAVLFTQG